MRLRAVQGIGVFFSVGSGAQICFPSFIEILAQKDQIG